MDFGLLGVPEIEALLSGLHGFNLATMAESLALTGTAHGVTPPGAELASLTANTGIQAQVADLDAICQASAANIMAYLMVSQSNTAGSVATDLASAAPFAMV